LLAGCAHERKDHRGTAAGAGGVEGGAATNEVAAAVLISRGPDSRVWQRVASQQLPDGRTVSRTNSFIEMATGMSYFENGEWKESRDEIEIVPTGAAATKSPHKLDLAPNINTFGAVTITTPDNQTVRATVLSLAYTDEATGRSAVFARIRNSDGLLFPPNQVLYPDAFSGGIVADVRVTSTRASVQSDVVLRTRLPAPRDCDPDLNPDSVFWKSGTSSLRPILARAPARPAE
jgi:hypothetical protein